MIRVDDVSYRWTVSPDSGYMCIVVERESDPGQRLEARVGYGEHEAGGQETEITPVVVRRAIELALGEGWRPRDRGQPPFRLADADRRLLL